MSNIHICLVSEQTIPNILGIYHFKPDKVIFCTTEKMEKQKRTDSIINTLKLYDVDYSDSNRNERVVVDQDCLDDCEMKFLKIAKRYCKDDVVVNLTGGTKIMVLGAYNIFKEMANRMIYTPIPKNEFITVFPKEVSCKSHVKYDLKLSVEGYITAYGVSINNKARIEQLKKNALSNREICEWMAKNYFKIEELLNKLYQEIGRHREEREYRLDFMYNFKCEEEKEFLSRLRINIENGMINSLLPKDRIRFLTGDWLSDYCYNEISRLSVDDCVTGIELTSPQGVNNEFDVMFTKDNALYMLECKTLNSSREKFQDFLYKISALQQDFGLRVSGFMVSTTRDILNVNGEIKPHIIKRAKQCSTKVIHPQDVMKIGEKIKNYLGLN